MKAKEEIPKEYQILCKGCGKILDMRDPSILRHGWIEDGKIICYDEELVEYSGSQKKGELLFWTKDKKSINLN